jgi:hypothetical protein
MLLLDALTLKALRDNLWLGYLGFSGDYGEKRAHRWLELYRVADAKFQATQ